MTEENVVVVRFTEPSKAYQALSVLKECDAGGRMGLESAAVVERTAAGELSIPESADNVGLVGTASGSLSGLPLSGGRSLLLALGGLLSLAFGVVMFAHPGAGAVALLALVAAFALVTGAMQIAFAIELRRGVVELDHRVRPHATAKPVTHG
jgi:uncharacterized membrane protein